MKVNVSNFKVMCPIHLSIFKTIYLTIHHIHMSINLYIIKVRNNHDGVGFPGLYVEVMTLIIYPIYLFIYLYIYLLFRPETT